MTLFQRLFGTNKNASMVTTLERERLNRTMPGQTGAINGARYGFMVR